VNGDCDPGQLCVKTAADGDAAGINVCQLPAENKCIYNSQCSPLVCARDQMCRNECVTTADCISPQVCTDSKVCALPTQLVPGTNDVKNALPDGGAGQGGSGAGGAGAAGGAVGSAGASGAGGASGPGGASGSGGKGAGGAAGTAGSACTGPQLQFNNVSQGDANRYFTSAVTMRNADTLFIFSAYQGPTTAPDGGADGGVVGNAMFVQMFDPKTGDKRGPAQSLFTIPSGLNVWVYDGSIAPTGEIALLYGVGPDTSYNTQLYASFLSVTPGDGGAAGVKVVKTVQIESVQAGDAHVIWAAHDGLFAFSWKYTGNAGAWFTKVQRYQPSGSAGGNAVGTVPTNTGSNYSPSQENDCALASSGSYYGVAFQANSGTPPYVGNGAYLTILDSQGFQVGSSFVWVSPNAGIGDWMGVGGTTQGFVSLFIISGGVGGSFVPLTGAGDVIVDGGLGKIGVDGGLPPLKTYSFSATASTGKIISDDTGGAGGVGAVLLESDGATFVYVLADGSKLFNEGAVISDSAGYEVNITNYHGSFAVSLFDNTNHYAKATVSSCN
jgi:hypothetical protein